MENEVKALKTDMSTCLRIVKKNKRRVIRNTLLFSLIGVVVAIIMSFNITDQYSASAVVYGSYEKAVAGYNVVEDYSTMVIGHNVCAKAISILGYKDMDVKELQGILSSEIPKDSSVLTIYATAETPKKATQIANAVAKAFVAEVNYMADMKAANVLNEVPEVSKVSSARRTLITVCVLFFMLGFMGTIILIVIKALTSKKIISIEECTMNGELEIIGILPDYERIS